MFDRWLHCLRRCNEDDRGTVLMLTLGLVPIIAGLIAVGTDAAVLFTHRRALASDAESAVLAAAQSADLEALYTSRDLRSLPLDCRVARDVVEERIARPNSRQRANGIVIARFECTRTSVVLRVRSKVELPFARHFGIDPTIEVATDAAASSPLRSPA